MGKKINPLSFRLGITQKHRSNWFTSFENYPYLLKKDRQTRILLIWLLKFIEETEKKKIFDLHHINIERFSENKKILIEIKTINKLDIKSLFEKYFFKYSSIFFELKKINYNQKIFFRFINIPSYLINASFILNLLISKIDKKVTFRRAVQAVIQEFNLLTKNISDNSKFVKSFGLTIKISGRIGGLDMANSLTVKEGTIALQTLKSNVSYKFERIETIFGTIGIKVWVSNEFN